MHQAVKLAKACSCESQLSTELLQDESGRQAVANLKDFLFVLVGQWASPFNCVYEIEDCQHDVVVFPVNRTSSLPSFFGHASVFSTNLDE